MPNVAVLIDAENVLPIYAHQIFESAAARGTVCSKEIYGAAPALTTWVEPVFEYAIHANLTIKASKWKNSSDIALVIGAMDLLIAGKADTVEVRVYETDESGNRLKGKTDYGLEEPYECAYFMLPQEAAYEFGDIEYMDSREARVLLALGREELALRLDESISQEEIDARFGSPDTWDERFQEAYALMGIPELESLDEDELAEPAGSYVAIIPVTNLGTDDGVGISANAYIQSYNEDGTVSKGSLIGSHEDAIPKLKPGETMYLAVLLKPAVEDYDANKMLDIRFALGPEQHAQIEHQRPKCPTTAQ